jgi:hypothetical protein
MNSFWQFLDKPFVELPWEQQLLAALAILGCVVLAAWTVAFAVRSLRRSRLHERRHVGRPVLISWQDGVGLRQSDDGFCKDISGGGMALDLPFPLKVHTRLNLRMAEAKLSGTGVVSRCRRIGPRYVVGVEFDRPTRALVNH